MMKLNNKGMTVVEILLSFTLVVIIVMNLFSIIMNYRAKVNVEILRDEYIVTKYQITRDIQNDILDLVLKEVTECGAKCVQFEYYSGAKKKLTIHDPQTADQIENKYIQYGDQKYKIRDVLPSNIPSGRDPLRYQSITIDPTITLTKDTYSVTEEENSLYSVYIGIRHAEFDEDFGILIVAPASVVV